MKKKKKKKKKKKIKWLLLPHFLCVIGTSPTSIIETMGDMLNWAIDISFLSFLRIVGGQVHGDILRPNLEIVDSGLIKPAFPFA